MEKVNLTERLFFYIVFLILIILALLMIQPYFPILVVSLISVIILKPVYSFYMKRSWIRERKTLAASLTLLSVFVILIIPVILMVWLTASQLAGLFEGKGTVQQGQLQEPPVPEAAGEFLLEPVQHPAVAFGQFRQCLHALIPIAGKPGPAAFFVEIYSCQKR